MNHRLNRTNHAYYQAPWRVERHWISVSLLFVMGSAMIATLYLMVTSKAAIIGREIQYLHEAIIITEQQNATLQSKLAELTSKEEIEEQAYELNFRLVNPQELEYLYVPGYVPPDGILMSTKPQLQPSPPSIPPEYTKSLLDWLSEQLQSSSGGYR